MLHQLHLGDGLDWMSERARNSVHAIVTDPPYGLREYDAVEQKKLRRGRGGVWRIPPALGGHRRSPLPRFTVLTPADHAKLQAFFERFASEALRVLVPGGHVFVATQ